MTNVRQVAAPDAASITSPILGLDEGPAHGVGARGEVCYFNDEAFEPGAEVQLDDALLRCERGNWVVAESPAGQPS